MVSSTSSYATDNDCTTSSTFYRGQTNSDDATSAPSLYLVYSFVDIKPVFDDLYDWIFYQREMARKEAIYLNKLFIEHFNRLQIAMIFNTYSVLFYRRMMFPKSGFLARAGRRKRN